MPIAFIFRAIIPAMQSGQDRSALALVFAWLVPMELLFGVMSVFSSTLSELVLDRESALRDADPQVGTPFPHTPSARDRNESKS